MFALHQSLHSQYGICLWTLLAVIVFLIMVVIFVVHVVRQNSRIEYPYKVDSGCYWVMGDNREVSMDSRSFGSVIKENIKGRLLFQNQ